MPATLDLQLYRGEDRVWTFVPVPGLQTRDISAWTAITFTFYNQMTPPAVVLTKSLGSGVSITNGPDGFFTLTVAAADTNGTVPLPPGVYPGDCWGIDDSGNQRAIAVGALTLRSTPSH